MQVDGHSSKQGLAGRKTGRLAGKQIGRNESMQLWFHDYCGQTDRQANELHTGKETEVEGMQQANKERRTV